MSKIAMLMATFAVLCGTSEAFAEQEVDCSRYIALGKALSNVYIKFDVDRNTNIVYGTNSGHIVTFNSVTRGSFSGSFGSGGDMHGGWSGSQFTMFNPAHDQTYSGICYDTGIRGRVIQAGVATAAFTFAP
ncbi:hypothetical protein WME89_41300 [Sorangium sp. So ce321]|uniref:hypothetical protein n=1 Tax=Sorangium sp. So ce321 TaxID=3133300 RepID=UPI003F63ABDE